MQSRAKMLATRVWDSTAGKIALGVAALLVLVAVVYFGDRIHDAVFDRRLDRNATVRNERSQREHELELQSTQQRARAEAAEKRAADAEVQLTALKAAGEALGGRVLAEQQRLEAATEEVRRETENTDAPTDARTRCERLRAKYAERGINVSDINCAAVAAPR